MHVLKRKANTLNIRYDMFLSNCHDLKLALMLL